MSNSDISFIGDLEQIIANRVAAASDKSYTASLLRAGTKRIAQKVGEEGVELALAAAAGDSDEVVEEAADLIYHVLVLLADQGLSIAEVAATLRLRHTK